MKDKAVLTVSVLFIHLTGRCQVSFELNTNKLAPRKYHAVANQVEALISDSACFVEASHASGSAKWTGVLGPGIKAKGIATALARKLEPGMPTGVAIQVRPGYLGPESEEAAATNPPTPQVAPRAEVAAEGDLPKLLEKWNKARAMCGCHSCGPSYGKLDRPCQVEQAFRALGGP